MTPLSSLAINATKLSYLRHPFLFRIRRNIIRNFKEKRVVPIQPTLHRSIADALHGHLVRLKLPAFPFADRRLANASDFSKLVLTDSENFFSDVFHRVHEGLIFRSELFVNIRFGILHIPFSMLEVRA